MNQKVKVSSAMDIGQYTIDTYRLTVGKRKGQYFKFQERNLFIYSVSQKICRQELLTLHSEDHRRIRLLPVVDKAQVRPRICRGDRLERDPVPLEVQVSSGVLLVVPPGQFVVIPQDPEPFPVGVGTLVTATSDALPLNQVNEGFRGHPGTGQGDVGPSSGHHVRGGRGKRLAVTGHDRDDVVAELVRVVQTWNGGKEDTG